MTRSCGPCRACCVVLRVEDLQKPPGEACRHLVPTGCGIYGDRPPSCRKFNCLWLAGALEERDRPDQLGALFWLTQNDLGTALQIHPVPGVAPKLRTLRLRDQFARRFVTVLMGEQAQVLKGPSNLLGPYREWKRRHEP